MRHIHGVFTPGRYTAFLALLWVDTALLGGCPRDDEATRSQHGDEADETSSSEATGDSPSDQEGESPPDEEPELDAGEAEHEAPDGEVERNGEMDAAKPALVDAAGAPNTTDSALAPVETVLGEMYSTVGVGGFPSFDGRAVVLLKDGWATRNTRLLFMPMDVAADRAANPGAYRQWKRFSNGLAEWNGKSWVLYEYQDQYGPLAEGATLQGVYSRLTGGGSISTGGDILITSQQVYNFGVDGTFARNVSGVVSSTSLTAANLPPDRHGSYEIDGYRLRLTYADGSVVATSLVTTGTKVAFIAGSAYTR